MEAALVDRFRAARRDPRAVVLEGFHAVKHAVRFGADLHELVASASADLDGLAAGLAPDLADRLAGARVVGDDELARLVPRAPRTGIVALAARPSIAADGICSASGDAPVVVLEAPRTMGNLGACVRVAAAAGAAGVVTTGPHDPWHPDAVRGAAGLQFALPVARLDGDGPAAADALASLARAFERPLLALDPVGDELGADAAQPLVRALLAFGTEREGLSEALLDRADGRLRLPMEPGVSSLNLATSVAATLYAWRLGRVVVNG